MFILHSIHLPCRLFNSQSQAAELKYLFRKKTYWKEYEKSAIRQKNLTN